MPGQVPNIIRVFRIVHIENVEYLLTHGMFTRHHPMADPNYINIGDTNLIGKRNNYPVKINPPNGVLGDYVPFYFGPLSPMLYNIWKGYKGITKRPQSDIVYIVCRVNTIFDLCANWCFTDGHAKAELSDPYNDPAHFSAVDWDMVFEQHWNNTEEDFDRVRRKQAEFLVKEHVPVKCIAGIVTYNEASKVIVENIVNRLGLEIPVKVNPNGYFYY